MFKNKLDLHLATNQDEPQMSTEPEGERNSKHIKSKILAKKMKIIRTLE